MANSKELSHLFDLVAEFERLDASLFDELKTGNMEVMDEVLNNTLSAKKEVKRYLSELGPLNVYPVLGQKLKKIRDNHGYSIDRVLHVFSRITGTASSQESEEEIDYVEALFSEGTADYVDTGFFTRKNQVGTLIVSEALPEPFVHHFHKLRECFSLGLFQPTVIYCRAVIETGCFEALRRKGKVKVASKVADIREYSLKKLMGSIKPFVYKGNWENADKVIKKADDVLHSKRKKVAVSEEDAFDAIKDTFAIIEELFSGGHGKGGRQHHPTSA